MSTKTIDDYKKAVKILKVKILEQESKQRNLQ
jgi:hypothetical protein